MKKNLKTFSRARVVTAGLAVLLIALVWGITLQHSGRERHKNVEEQTSRSEADFYLKTVTFREFEREKSIWRMDAEDARIFQDDDLALIRNIHSTFYQEGGKNITITGNKGRIKLSSMNISISGDVHAKSDDGTQLFAESFDWDNRKRRATSNDFIRIIRDNIQIEGIGLELDPDRQIFTIEKDVRTFIGNIEG